jgi:hypothetical protein
MSTQNYINHVAFVLDASWSMNPYRNDLVSVIDDLTGYLAKRSQELDQETRITVYTFNDLGGWGAPRPNIQCVFYDKDALRLPSIKNHYKPDGGTPLLDAYLKAIDDLEKTAQLYGDHAFLIYGATDGEENRSRPDAQRKLESKLKALPDNWTNALLVPDQEGRRNAVRFGFPSDNIAIWEPTSAAGVARGGDMIRAATETYMTSRASGVRGTRSLFSTGADAVNKQTVSTLTPLDPSSFDLHKVERDMPINEWARSVTGREYRTGSCFYQLIKTETIQPQKRVIVLERRTGKAFTGPDARNIVGLPAMTVRVKPDWNPDYDLYIESTSSNRKMVAGQQGVILK